MANIVRGGAFCRDGDTGETSKGTPMACQIARDGRLRMRRTNPAATPLPDATQITTALAQPERPVVTTEPEFGTPEYWQAVAARAHNAAVAAMAAEQPGRAQRAQLHADQAAARAKHMAAQRARIAPVDGPPVSGAPNATVPLDQNGWGFAPSRPTAYHPDGPIGHAVASMGGDKHMDVDGQPLANVLGRTATDVVDGRRTPQEGLDAYKTILGRLPQGSRAHAELADAIATMDGPALPAPTVPAEVPQPLHQLMHHLHAIPLARTDRREIDRLQTIIDGFMTGQLGGSRLVQQVRMDLHNVRHESYGDAGKCQIDEAVREAVEALRLGPPDALAPPNRRQ